VRIRAVAGEAVLLHLDRGEYFTLNATGLRVWELAQGGRTFSEAVEALEREFEAPAEDLAADAAAVLDDLRRAGLLLPADGESPAGSVT
jgi:hypothetical protein